MTKTLRWLLVTSVAFAAVLGSGVARAQTACNDANCEQAQNGNNSSRTNQSGSSKSGDAVGGQVTGVVSVDSRLTWREDDGSTK